MNTVNDVGDAFTLFEYDEQIHLMIDLKRELLSKWSLENYLFLMLEIWRKIWYNISVLLWSQLVTTHASTMVDNFVMISYCYYYYENTLDHLKKKVLKTISKTWCHRNTHTLLQWEYQVGDYQPTYMKSSIKNF